jgi:hypothetical protein
MLNYQSIIHPDDENFPFGPSSVSRGFELLQVASVRMSQQHCRTPFSVRQGKGFRSKTQIWEYSCNHTDDVCSRSDAILDKASRAYKVQLSGRQSPWFGHASLNMEIVCRRSPTVWTSVSMVQTLKPQYENCVQLKCKRPDARATPSKHGSIQERISREFEKPIAQLSVRTASTTVQTPPRKIASDEI